MGFFFVRLALLCTYEQRRVSPLMRRCFWRQKTKVAAKSDTKLPSQVNEKANVATRLKNILYIFQQGQTQTAGSTAANSRSIRCGHQKCCNPTLVTYGCHGHTWNLLSLQLPLLTVSSLRTIKISRTMMPAPFVFFYCFFALLWGQQGEGQLWKWLTLRGRVSHWHMAGIITKSLRPLGTIEPLIIATFSTSTTAS